MVILIVPFLFGAAIGSFLNVCIYRVPLGLSIVSPPSACPGCGKKIAFYDNIPILSYLLLGGRCRGCGSKISARYPLIEAATGLLASALVYKFGLGPELFVYFVFASALIVITFIDLKYQIIPDVISLPGIALGFAASFVTSEPGVVNSIIGILIGGGLLYAIASAYYLVTKHEGMGGGDIKMLAMIGAFTGWKGVLVTILAGSFSGALIGGALMLFSGKGSRHAIPFGPFLALGALLYLFFGEAAVGWYVTTVIGE